MCVPDYSYPSMTDVNGMSIYCEFQLALHLPNVRGVEFMDLSPQVFANSCAFTWFGLSVDGSRRGPCVVASELEELERMAGDVICGSPAFATPNATSAGSKCKRVPPMLNRFFLRKLKKSRQSGQSLVFCQLGSSLA